MTTGYVGPGGNWISVADTPNQGNGADSADYTPLTASGAVRAVPATFLGYEVTVALSAAAITIYDNASAASGNVLCVIPASTGVGAYKLPVGIKATAGIYASFGGTGTVNFLWN